MEDYKCGSVFDGVAAERVKDILPLAVGKRSECSTCWCRYFCGGGCLHEAYTFGKSEGDPRGPLCDLYRLIVEYYIYGAYLYWDELANELRQPSSVTGSPLDPTIVEEYDESEE